MKLRPRVQARLRSLHRGRQTPRLRCESICPPYLFLQFHPLHSNSTHLLQFDLILHNSHRGRTGRLVECTVASICISYARMVLCLKRSISSGHIFMPTSRIKWNWMLMHI